MPKRVPPPTQLQIKNAKRREKPYKPADGGACTSRSRQAAASFGVLGAGLDQLCRAILEDVATDGVAMQTPVLPSHGNITRIREVIVMTGLSRASLDG